MSRLRLLVLLPLLACSSGSPPGPSGGSGPPAGTGGVPMGGVGGSPVGGMAGMPLGGSGAGGMPVGGSGAGGMPMGGSGTGGMPMGGSGAGGMPVGGSGAGGMPVGGSGTGGLPVGGSGTGGMPVGGSGAGGMPVGGSGTGGMPMGGSMMQAEIGLSCGSAGQLTYSGSGLLACGQGRWRYAMRADVPDAPAGGFTTRPDWFPTLGTVFGLPTDTCASGDTVHLTEAPIAAADLTTIVPYGLLAGDHVTPIDHMYLGVAPLELDAQARVTAAYVPVRAPADGTIIEASSLGSPTSMRVVISHRCQTITVFMVLNKLTGPLAKYQDQVSSGAYLRLNEPIEAGETFALERDNPVDFSLHDGSRWLPGFAHPFPYTMAESWKPYTVDPLPYFTAEIAAVYRDKLQRTESPRAGRIDWDKVGSASGNWFREGTMGYGGQSVETYRNATAPVPGGMVPGKNGYSWGHLALVPHWVQPSVWMASLGTWSDPAGDFRQFAIRPGPKPPDQLTPADGPVVYELTTWSVAGPDGKPIEIRGSMPVGYQVLLNEGVVGVLAVRVNADGTLTVEKRPDLKTAAAFTAFGPQAENYWR